MRRRAQNSTSWRYCKRFHLGRQAKNDFSPCFLLQFFVAYIGCGAEIKRRLVSPKRGRFRRNREPFFQIFLGRPFFGVVRQAENSRNLRRLLRKAPRRLQGRLRSDVAGTLWIKWVYSNSRSTSQFFLLHFRLSSRERCFVRRWPKRSERLRAKRADALRAFSRRV